MKNLRVVVAIGYAVSIFLIASGVAGCSGQSDTTNKAGKSAQTATVEPKDYAENFVGEWKSIESEERPHMKISLNGENFIMQSGNKTVPGVYDKESKVIKVNAEVPLDVMYLEKENMLLVSGRGKYTKVTETTDK